MGLVKNFLNLMFCLHLACVVARLVYEKFTQTDTLIYMYKQQNLDNYKLQTW